MSDLEKSPESSSFTMGPMGYSTGNMYIDLLFNMMAGGKLAPKPATNSKQSAYSAYLNYNRSQDFLSLMRKSTADSFAMQKMFGKVDPDSMVMRSFLSPFLTNPDSLVSKALATVNGGNPVKAQMGMYADLTGQTMGAFGQVGNASAREVTGLADTLYKRFYKSENIDKQYAGEYVKQARNNAAKIISRDGLSGDFVNDFDAALGSSAGISAYQSRYGTGDNEKLGGILKSNLDRTNQIKADPNLTDSQRKKAIDDLVDGSQRAAKKLIDTISNPEAQAKMATAFRTAIGEGTQAGVQGFTDKYNTQMGRLASVMEGVSKIYDQADANGGQGTKRITGVNFDNTRGFQIEDITSAFTKAADLRLMSRKSMTDSMQDFGQNGLSVLDAARGLYGNDKTGAELVTEIHNLLGKGSTDLGDPAQAREMEDLFRRVKASAHIAGISIESMVGIINETKRITELSPRLNALSGARIAEFSRKSMNTTTAQAAFFGQEQMRLMGGPQGVFDANQAGELQAIAQPISQNAYALYNHFSQRKDAGSVKATAIIKQFLARKDISGNAREDLNQLTAQVASVSGENVFNLRSMADNNKWGSSQGIVKIEAENTRIRERNAEREKRNAARKPGEKMEKNEDEIDIADTGKRYMAGLIKTAAVNEMTAMGGTGVVSDALIDYTFTDGTQSIDDFLRQRKIGDHELSAQDRIKKKIINDRVQDSRRSGNNGRYRAMKKEVDVRTNYYKDQEKQYADQYGALYAPPAQALVQKLMSTGLGESGITDLLSNFKTKDEGKRAAITATINQINEVSHAVDPSKVNTLMTDLINQSRADNNRKQNISPAESAAHEQMRGKLDDSTIVEWAKGKDVKQIKEEMTKRVQAAQGQGAPQEQQDFLKRLQDSPQLLIDAMGHVSKNTEVLPTEVLAYSQIHDKDKISKTTILDWAKSKDVKKIKAEMQQRLVADTKLGRPPEELARLQRLIDNPQSLLDAASFSYKTNLSDESSVVNAAQTAALFHVQHLTHEQFDASLGKQAQEAYKNLPESPSIPSNIDKEAVKKARNEMLPDLIKFGVIDKDTKEFNAEAFRQLQERGDKDFIKFKEDVYNTKDPAKKATLDTIQKIGDDYTERYHDSRRMDPKFAADAEAATSRDKMMKAMESLANNLGPGFGDKLVQAIGLLSGTVNQALGMSGTAQ